MFIVLTSIILKTHEELTQEMLKFDGFSLAEHLHIGNWQGKNRENMTFFSLSLITCTIYLDYIFLRRRGNVAL